MSWQAGVSKLDSTRLGLLNWTLLYNRFARTTQKTQPLYCWESMFTVPLYSKRSCSIVAYVFVAAGMCLRIRCLTMNVYSDILIPTFGRHVTLCFLWDENCLNLISLFWKNESRLRRSCCCLCLINTFQRQRTNMQQWKNCWTPCFLYGPCHIKYWICSKRKVGD
jgi:hypothetical protein